MEQFNLELIETKELSDHTTHFIFRRKDNKKLNFKAGQFISLLFKNNEGVLTRRNYSLANVPDSEHLEFACSYIKGGLASEVLFNLKPGDELLSAGPFGLLVLPENNAAKNYFLFATGTGVTPYRSMLPTISEKIAKDNAKFHLIFGVRKKEHLLYKDEFVEFAKRHPNFEFHACYSQESLVEGLESYENLGRVLTKVQHLNITNEDLVYLCGNPNMVDEVFATLTEQGIERRNIKREKYISSK